MSEKPYVAVVGGANIDIAGRPHAHLVPRDSNLGTVRLSQGGVGRNIAHNLALLGVDTRLVTCFGDDELADVLTRGCLDAGIDIAHSFVVPGCASSTYLYVADEAGEMQLAINDMGILDAMTPERLEERAPILQGAAAIVIDANLPAPTIDWVARHARVPLFCDPISTVKAARVTGALGYLHALKPNRLEAEALSGVGIVDDVSAVRAARALLSSGLAQAFVSLGEDGVLCADDHEAVRLPLLPCRVTNTTGAGDAMMAGIIWGHLHDLGLADAGLAGLAASAIAVESDQTVSPHMSEENLVDRMSRA